MKLSEIEPVARVVKDGPDYGLIESEVIQGISMLPAGTELYTADQMQEYAKECVREAIILNSGGAVSDDMIKRAIDSVFTKGTKND